MLFLCVILFYSRLNSYLKLIECFNQQTLALLVAGAFSAPTPQSSTSQDTQRFVPLVIQHPDDAAGTFVPVVVSAPGDPETPIDNSQKESTTIILEEVIEEFTTEESVITDVIEGSSVSSDVTAASEQNAEEQIIEKIQKVAEIEESLAEVIDTEIDSAVPNNTINIDLATVEQIVKVIENEQILEDEISQTVSEIEAVVKNEIAVLPSQSNSGIRHIESEQVLENEILDKVPATTLTESEILIGEKLLDDTISHNPLPNAMSTVMAMVLQAASDSIVAEQAAKNEGFEVEIEESVVSTLVANDEAPLGKQLITGEEEIVVEIVPEVEETVVEVIPKVLETVIVETPIVEEVVEKVVVAEEASAAEEGTVRTVPEVQETVEEVAIQVIPAAEEIVEKVAVQETAQDLVVEVVPVVQNDVEEAVEQAVVDVTPAVQEAVEEIVIEALVEVIPAAEELVEEVVVQDTEEVAVEAVVEAVPAVQEVVQEVVVEVLPVVQNAVEDTVEQAVVEVIPAVQEAVEDVVIEALVEVIPAGEELIEEVVVQATEEAVVEAVPTVDEAVEEAAEEVVIEVIPAADELVQEVVQEAVREVVAELVPAVEVVVQEAVTEIILAVEEVVVEDGTVDDEAVIEVVEQDAAEEVRVVEEAIIAEVATEDLNVVETPVIRIEESVVTEISIAQDNIVVESESVVVPEVAISEVEELITEVVPVLKTKAVEEQVDVITKESSIVTEANLNQEELRQIEEIIVNVETPIQEISADSLGKSIITPIAVEEVQDSVAVVVPEKIIVDSSLRENADDLRELSVIEESLVEEIPSVDTIAVRIIDDTKPVTESPLQINVEIDIVPESLNVQEAIVFEESLPVVSEAPKVIEPVREVPIPSLVQRRPKQIPQPALQNLIIGRRGSVVFETSNFGSSVSPTNFILGQPVRVPQTVIFNSGPPPSIPPQTDPLTLVDPQFRQFIFPNDSPDVIAAKVNFFRVRSATLGGTRPLVNPGPSLPATAAV